MGADEVKWAPLLQSIGRQMGNTKLSVHRKLSCFERRCPYCTVARFKLGDKSYGFFNADCPLWNR
jgi:hypothetical protein